MSEVHVLTLWDKTEYDGVDINTASNSGEYRDLSPFILTGKPYAKNLENLWQYSKVYSYHIDGKGFPNDQWYEWRYAGWHDNVAHRYPMGKGAVPLYSYWANKKLGYVEARKTIYAQYYAANVIDTKSYKLLKEIYDNDLDIILRDYDAYDHIKLGMTLKEVINNPNKKMGHAFVLAMMLTGVLEDCLQRRIMLWHH